MNSTTKTIKENLVEFKKNPSQKPPYRESNSYLPEDSEQIAMKFTSQTETDPFLNHFYAHTRFIIHILT